MSRGRLLVLCLLSLAALVREPPAAQAQGGTRFSGASTLATNSRQQDTRSVFICGIPDTQSEVSMNAYIQVGPEIDCKPWQDPPFRNCVGTYCDKSVWCSTTWRATGRTLMRNRAYALTGQWDKIDFTGADPNGLDKTRSHWANALDHPRCDVILSFGDMSDVQDGIVATDPSYAQLDANSRHQIDVVAEFWTIIRASGIPFLPLPGNHDPTKTYRDLMTGVLSFQSLPFYYAHEPTKTLEYAIRFPTATGKQLCVIGLMSDSSLSPDTLDLTQSNWVLSTIGCGAGLPTIVVQHEGSTLASQLDLVAPSGVLNPGDPANVVLDPGNSEVFLIAGGHFLTTPSTKAFSGSAGPGGFDYLALYSNWQNLPRHDLGGTCPACVPYGNSTRDSAGLWHTVIELNPARSQLSAHDFSPYWVRTQSVGIPLTSYAEMTSQISVSFPFDTRFPP